MNNCPKCGSKEIYRKALDDLVVYCDCCHHSWEDKQPKRPILETSVYMSRGAMKGKHNVTVWHCPTDPERYSFSLTYGGGVCMFSEFSEDRYLSGSYTTPEEALEAGITEVKNDD
ncbi:hypothetical protein ANSO36C_62740 (plasmid) [Nostoc cf. commune SO-36]|uniref:Uncharacterized protein n=1 Tax=Nostoc cf. commune SO-36 TaxID=449208 RepID=A0ABN6QBA4_NOSCO|nr:hypothetical protein [Nostoc commune]BDI20472.1 hypothetical protein ANSO36C_62740 [Nostoc cf. commune SO-36]